MGQALGGLVFFVARLKSRKKNQTNPNPAGKLANFCKLCGRQVPNDAAAGGGLHVEHGGEEHALSRGVAGGFGVTNVFDLDRKISLLERFLEFGLEAFDRGGTTAENDR